MEGEPRDAGAPGGDQARAAADDRAASPRQADLWVERFRREANVIAGLQSPHTIYLYDFGVSRDGQFYYVMELLDGISLQTLVTTFGPQPVGARPRHPAADLRVAGGGAPADLVHRDLKPSNVMLCKLALTYDFVKVLDFGLAKCAACEDVTQLTMEGTTAGTPGYIAPEVALGEIESTAAPTSTRWAASPISSSPARSSSRIRIR